jgi:hypothetical protein
VKVRQKRLIGLLKETGFKYGPKSRTSDDLIFTRPSQIGELFESIIVGCQGKSGEAVYASVGVAVTRKVMYKLLGDVQFLEEVGEDPQRGWTIIEDDGKAIQWESRLAEIGPIRAMEWANARGPQLLQDTAQARAAVAEYYNLLKPAESLEATLLEMKSTTRKQLAEDAERLSTCPLFRNGPDAELAYQIACQVILSHSERIDGTSYIGHDPMNDTALLERIEILVDKLSTASGAD